MQGVHSALAPMGPHAQIAGHLGDLMYGISAAVFLLVVGALAWAALHRRRPDDPGDAPGRQRQMTFGVAAAVGATVATLLLVLLTDYKAGRAYAARPPGAPIQIQVTGYQWWWDVQYRDQHPQHWATTANEIRVPVGRPVVLELRSNDVIHSFWVPNLVGKRDLIPGKVTSLWFRADTPGVYWGQCAEYCGYQHAKMAFQVIAEPPEAFARWLAAQRDTARTPTDSLTRLGQAVFLGNSCVMCHAVRGTPAGSHIGPDLTHLASRRTIGAGTLPNVRGALAGWIVDPQAIKPGVRMPPNPLHPHDLEALVAYLETLR